MLLYATDFSYFQAIIKMYDSELLEEFEKWNGIDDHPEKLMWLLSNLNFYVLNFLKISKIKIQFEFLIYNKTIFIYLLILFKKYLIITIFSFNIN